MKKLGILIAILVLIGGGLVATQVFATGQQDPTCGSYEKERTDGEGDFENDIVKIDFTDFQNPQGSSNDGYYKITLQGKNGWTITNWYLEVANNNTQGWDVTGSGDVSNYNPQGNQIEEVKVVLHKDCPTPTPTPTESPTPTPTESPSPTPTPDPCELNDVVCCDKEPDERECQPEETPIPTPTATPQPEQPKSDPAPAGAPTCGDQVPGGVANIFVDRGEPNDGKLEVRWTPDQPKGNQAHIRYTDGQDGDWRFALLNTENDGVEEIGELQNGVHYWFQVAQVNGCAVGAWSKSFDPLP